MPDPNVDIARVVRLARIAGDVGRLKILLALASGPRYVGSISDAIGLDQNATSGKLSRLRDGLLVTSRRDWREVEYELTDDGRKVVEAARLMGGN